MKTKEFCNQTFRDLLARLGEISLSLHQLHQKEEEIRAQISLLNSLSPELQKIEKELTDHE